MKRNTVNKKIAVALAMSMMLGAGCGSVLTANAAEGTNLSIMWWGGDARHEATQQVLDLYTQETGTSFQVEFTGWDGYWQKLPVLAASNAMTDVLQMDAAYIDQYITNGALADLTDYIDLTEFMSQEEADTYLRDGKLYGVPLSKNGQGIIYSKTRLAELGIEEPKNGWTWEEMADWGRAAKEKCPEGVYPLFYQVDWYEYFQKWVQSHGGEKTLDGNNFNFDTEAFKDFMEFYQGLVEEGVCPPAEVELSHVEYDPLNDYFLNQKVLTRTLSIGSVATISDMMPDEELGFVSMPQGEGGSGWVQSTIFFAIGANSEKKEEAAEFIKWFLGDEEAGKLLKTVRGLPLSDEVYETIEADLTPAEQKGMEFYQVLTAEGVNFTPYWDDVPAAFTNWNIEYRSISQEVMIGDISIEEAAEYLLEIGEEAAAEAAQ